MKPVLPSMRSPRRFLSVCRWPLLAALVGLAALTGPKARAQDPQIDHVKPTSIKFLKTEVDSTYYGFDEWVSTVAQYERPKKYATLTWHGTLAEANDGSDGGFGMSGITTFSGQAKWVGADYQNGLDEFSVINGSDGGGGPYTVIGFPGGGCLPISIDNVFIDRPGSPGISLRGQTSLDVTPLVRSVTGAIQWDWTDVALPCNMIDFHEGSNVFSQTGPVTETLSDLVTKPGDVKTVVDPNTVEMDPEQTTVMAYRSFDGDPLVAADISYHFEAVFRVCSTTVTRQVRLVADRYKGSRYGDHSTPEHVEVVLASNPVVKDDGTVSVEGELSLQKLFDGLPDNVSGVVVLKGIFLDIDAGSCGAACSLHPDPGSTNTWSDSIHWQMNLGMLASQAPAGALRLDAKTFTAAVYGPGSLNFVGPAVPSADVVAVRRPDGSLRQVRTGAFLADIIGPAEDSSLPASAFEVRFFTQVGSTISPDDPALRVPAGPALHTTRFYDPDGNGNRLRIDRYTSSLAQAFDVVEFAYAAATNTWSFTEQGLRRTDRTITPTSATEYDMTTSVWDLTPASPALVNKLREHFLTTVQDGVTVTTKTQETRDPDGAALTSQWTFDPTTLRQLSYRSFTGAWEKRGEYTVSDWWSGTTTHYFMTTTPFVNAAFDGSGGRSQTVNDTVITVSDVDGDQVGEQQTTHNDNVTGVTTITQELSKQVSRGGQLLRATRQARIVTAPFDTSHPNLRWETFQSYANGAFAGRRAYHLDLAGVLETTTYLIDSTTGRLTETAEAGAPNADNSAVVDGTRTITVTNPDGNLFTRTTQDIATGLTLGSETVLAYDDHGRATQIAYLDGSVETRVYSVCCGLLQSTSRYGLTTTYTYDVLKRKIAETSPDGITLLYDYDAMDRVVRTRRRGTDNSEMVLSTATYDLAGRMIATTNALSATTAFGVTYNPDGTTTRTTTAPDASTLIEVTNADGSPASRSGTQAAPVFYSYDVGSSPSGVPCIVTTENKAAPGTVATEWTKTYRDGLGRAVAVQYPGGALQTRSYNDAEQLVSTADPDGVTTLYGYNAKGEQDTVALDLDHNGQIDLAGTDRISRTTRVAASAHGTAVVRTTTSVSMANGVPDLQDVSVTESSADGLNAWQTSYGVTTQTQLVYNPDGSRTQTVSSADGTQTVSVYQANRLGSVVVQRPSLGTLSSTSYVYDAHGRIQSTTDARNGATTYSYFADDQVHTVTTPDPDPARSGPGYDPQTTTIAYDAMGRQITVAQPDGGVVNTTYYPTGLVKRTWGSRTYPVEYAYDAQNRVATLTTWQNFAGDAGKAVTQWAYDAQRGWLAAKTYADGHSLLYGYTAAGRLQNRYLARAHATPITYTYNSVGEVSSVSYFDATPAVSFSYDRLGRLHTRADAAGTCTYSYLGVTPLVTAESCTGGLLDGQGVSRNYDALLRLSSVAAAAAPATGYQYDAASRLAKVTSGSNAAAYAYVPNSALVQGIAFTNGPTPYLTTTKSYDNLDRLAAISHALNTQPSSLNFNYTYNAANQRTRVTHADGAYWSYAYDALGQVTAGRKYLGDDTPALGQNYGYDYDDIGNRKTATVNGRASAYTANTVNQYVQRTVPGSFDLLGTADAAAVVTANGAPVQRQGETFYQSLSLPNTSSSQYASIAVNGVRTGAGTSGADVNVTQNRSVFIAQTPENLTYDADGNLTSDDRWIYTWDAENQLIGCETQPAAVTAGAPKQKLVFAYDGQGRRIQKKVYTWSTAIGAYQLANDTRFVYDGWNLLAELSVNGSVATVRCAYLWGTDLSGSMQGAGGVGGLLFRVDGAATYAYACDGNGNVAGLVNATDGSLAAHYDYNAFGETVEISGPAATANLFRFSTKLTDGETGLYYYGYRLYQPTSGRWLSRDPGEENGGLNLYGFVDNNPVSLYDLLGLASRQGVIEAFCRLKACDRETLLKKLGSKSVQFFKSGTGRRFKVYEDATGARYEVPNGNFAGTREGDLIYLEDSGSDDQALGRIFHESDHIDNDDNSPSSTIDEAIRKRASNERRAYHNEAEFALNSGLPNDFITGLFKRRVDDAAIADWVRENYEKNMETSRPGRVPNPTPPASKPGAPVPPPPARRDPLRAEIHRQDNDGAALNASDFKCTK